MGLDPTTTTSKSTAKQCSAHARKNRAILIKRINILKGTLLGFKDYFACTNSGYLYMLYLFMESLYALYRYISQAIRCTHSRKALVKARILSGVVGGEAG